MSRRTYMKELIGTNKYDDLFKNMIRDYYIYGFKSADQFQRKSILGHNWKMLGKILGDKWYLEKGKNGRNRIVLKTTEHDDENPLDGLYSMHSLSYIGDFLNYLLILDERTWLREGLASLGVTEEDLTDDGRLMDKNELEYAVMVCWMRDLRAMSVRGKGSADRKQYPVMINRQLNLLSPQTAWYPSKKDRYKNLDDRTRQLFLLGVLGNLKYDSRRRTAWLQKVWRAYLKGGTALLEETGSPEGRSFSSYEGRAGIQYWYKSALSMRSLVEYGEALFRKGEPEDRRARSICFSQRFWDLCSFFSQYQILGEVGTFLKRRLVHGIEKPEKGIFRFRHQYLQRSLYDYNLIDILNAAEQKQLCWIRYSHGTHDWMTERIVIPLEIRISVGNGREYVLYYDLENRKIGSLRLEFIDRIVVWKNVRRIMRVERSERREGRKKEKKIRILGEVPLDLEELARQTALAGEMLPYIWGTDVGECFVDACWRQRLRTCRIQVDYDPETESFIRERLQKENRQGKSEIEKKEIVVQCFPTKELRTWLRSFYVRVVKTEQIDEPDFHMEEDVSKMWDLYFGQQRLQKEKQETDVLADPVLEGYEVEGEKVSEMEGHAALFHEIFSAHSAALANAVLKGSGQNGGDFRELLEREVRESFPTYQEQEIEETVQAMEEIARASGLLDEEGSTRYVTEQKDYFYELLPITRMECRWLVTALEDPVSEMFLPEDIRRRLVTFMEEQVPFAIRSLPVEYICYFDRYHTYGGTIHQNGKNSMTKEERENAGILYEALRLEKKLRVTYRNGRGEKRCRVSGPACLEYSLRDDQFRIWDRFRNRDEEKVGKINLSRILAVEKTEESYSRMEVQKISIEEEERATVCLKVEFYEGKRNLPDRILTEFSLWKKKCVYEETTGLYKMSLYYPKEDEKEVLIRLLGYGPYIRVSSDDENNTVCRELKRRVGVQRERIRSREEER